MMEADTQMEADSTTNDGSTKPDVIQSDFPFNPLPGNLRLYNEFIDDDGDQRLECQLVQKLQSFGLMPAVMMCPSKEPDCRLICRTARVIDRVQWVCEGCGKTQPIRKGSFFYRIQCSILQTMQLIFAWCEDAAVEVAAKHFGVKSKVAHQIYDRLDELATREQKKCKMGGAGSVALAEMYPDCVNGLSPDTTDQPHVHRILMVVDNKHIPTAAWLHVMKDDKKKTVNGAPDTMAFELEVERVIRKVVIPGTSVLTLNNVPRIKDSLHIEKVLQRCSPDMAHFLTNRIWRQAFALCCASRSMCRARLSHAQCGAAMQRYLFTALYRLRHRDGFYHQVLMNIARKYTDRVAS